jgi:AraC family transcriptional regulator
MDDGVRDIDTPERLTRCPAASDVGFCWAGGSVHLRTQSALGHCERRMVRNDLAVGICFQYPGSTVRWRLNGRTVLDKAWSANGGTLDLIILPAGHEFIGNCSGNGQGLWLFFGSEAMTSDAAVSALAGQPRVDGTWSQDRLSRVIANELRIECRNGFPRGGLFLESAAKALLVQLAFLFEKVLPGAEGARTLGKAKLAVVLEYLQAHLDRNVTLAELAALVNLTPRYFCEAFRRAIGRPPHQFQLEQRVERAKSLLQQSTVSVSEIALLAGFSSQSHLNVCFRRLVGVTPARYRAAHHTS